MCITRLPMHRVGLSSPARSLTPSQASALPEPWAIPSRRSGAGEDGSTAKASAAPGRLRAPPVAVDVARLDHVAVSIDVEAPAKVELDRRRIQMGIRAQREME
jgi:hypothetical protein